MRVPVHRPVRDKTLLRPTALVAALLLALTTARPAKALACPGETAGRVMGFLNDGTNHWPDARPPVRWTLERDVRWRTPLPSWGHGSPVVAGDRLFVTSEPSELLALRLADGKLLWRRSIEVADALQGPLATEARRAAAEEKRLVPEREQLTQERDRLKRVARSTHPPPGTSERLRTITARLDEIGAALGALGRFLTPKVPYLGTAASTPVTDGNRVCATFGHRVAACLSLDGGLQWARWFPGDGGASSEAHEGDVASPRLLGGRLLVALDRLRALSVDDGRELWADDRPYAALGSPLLVDRAGGAWVATPSGDLLDACSGAAVARGLARTLFVGAVRAGDGLFWAGTEHLAPRWAAAANGFELPQGPSGAPPTRRFRRELPADEYGATPLATASWILLADRSGRLHLLDARDGQPRPLPPLPALGPVHASPALAGGKAYVSAAGGRSVVLDPDAGFVLLATNDGPATNSTPVFVGERIYLRTPTELVCIGSAPLPGEGANR